MRTEEHKQNIQVGDINEILLRKVPCEIRHIVTKRDAAVDDALMNSFTPPTHTSYFSLPPTKYQFLFIPAYGWNLFSFEWQLNRAFDKK